MENGKIMCQPIGGIFGKWVLEGDRHLLEGDRHLLDGNDKVYVAFGRVSLCFHPKQCRIELWSCGCDIGRV